MEKTLVIDGRQVPFRSTGAFLLRYKMQFQRDALKDLVKLGPLIKQVQAMGETEDMEQLANIIETLDLQLFYNFAWVLAKVADNSIPEPMTWLDSFGEFPIMDIMSDLMELIEKSIGVSKKN